MDYKDTRLNFLQSDCLERFGVEKGMLIYALSVGKLISLSDRSGGGILTRQLVLPVMAYYKALLSFDCSEAMALDLVSIEIKKATEQLAQRITLVSKLPLPKALIKPVVKAAVKKVFPERDWDTKWLSGGKNELCFELNRCVYERLTKKEHCPELFPLFCGFCEASLLGLTPVISFERTSAICVGAKSCRFVFRV